MVNGSVDFANNVRHLTQNHENPFSLLLLVLYNNNEIQEQNPFKWI